ncbi:RNA polymerase sigma factor [Flagellimonas marina]|uniref:RNA polymerase sigma factor n=1 Tax=Flagellimonas marina TaxID=1775168 RepID=A0ABV8PG30_9FLAO
MSRFIESKILEADEQLIKNALSGNKSALENLIKKHQNWIYNVALNLTADSNEAADLLQEVLIKVITNLGQFKSESKFQTWVYRIIKNHFLNVKRSKYHNQVISWEDYGNGLDQTKHIDLEDSFQVDKKMVVQEAKLSCMKGMLLCLTPEQRLIFVIGELFELPDTTGSEILEINRDAFRKRLSRARKQLYDFMNGKCGLINKRNPCRCAKKTQGFIKKGYVDPNNLQFQKKVIAKIESVVEKKLMDYENDGYAAYQKLYQNHNYQEPDDRLLSLKKFLDSKAVRKTFDIQ